MLAGTALLGIGAAVDRLLPGGAVADNTQSADTKIRFYGGHQAGIATPTQSFVNFAAFDLTSHASGDFRSLLEAWSGAAAELTRGQAITQGSAAPSEPPRDNGEAIGLGPARLTLTFGFGPSLFAEGRAGVEAPPALVPLPPFNGEALVRDRSDGDICVQACADNPQVAFHAIHLLSRIAGSVATLRWQQQGFGRTSSTSRAQSTPRNLIGFKDGTDNIRGEDTEAMSDYVWVGRGDGPSWMEGGSYLIARRIQILFDVWDATSLEGQERVIGRRKLSGAPLGGHSEYDPVDLNATVDGALAIPSNAHIRLAREKGVRGERILRRGYSYAEPPEPGSGQIDAGLFFICFQRDPRRQFIPLQQRLAASDALNHHTLHTASAIFACPPGAKRGGFIGEGLFA
jgi:deferrochelatase/peroxidase EfeB